MREQVSQTPANTATAFFPHSLSYFLLEFPSTSDPVSSQPPQPLHSRTSTFKIFLLSFSCVLAYIKKQHN